MQCNQVRSLVRELRSHVLQSNQAPVPQLLSLEPTNHNYRVHEPQGKIQCAATKILRTKLRSNAVKKTNMFFKN